MAESRDVLDVVLVTRLSSRVSDCRGSISPSQTACSVPGRASTAKWTSRSSGRHSRPAVSVRTLPDRLRCAVNPDALVMKVVSEATGRQRNLFIRSWGKGSRTLPKSTAAFTSVPCFVAFVLEFCSIWRNRLNGVVHRHDVLRRNIGHDVMHLLKDKSTSRAEYLDLLPHMLGHLFGRCAWQDALRIASSAPKRQPIAKFTFEACGLHPPAGDLHGIDRIEPGVDQVVQQFVDAATTVQHDLSRPPIPWHDATSLRDAV